MIYNTINEQEAKKGSEHIKYTPSIHAQEVNPSNYLNTTKPSAYVNKNIWTALPSIKNSILRSQVDKFNKCFVYVLSNYSLGMPTSIFPALLIYVEEDHVFIEWPFRDYRIGFSLEPIEEDSSYFIITNTKLGEITQSGKFGSNETLDVLVYVIKFVLSNI